MSAPPRDPIPIPGFTDPVSCWTHLLASGVALVAGVFLVRRARGSGPRVAAITVFVACAVFMFAMSGVYHLLDRGGAGRAVLQRLDHAGIFAMIAGTFTGLHGAAFRGPWRWAFILVLWVLAATGITLKTIFFASTSEALGLTLYLGMGWLGVVSFFVIRKASGPDVARLILIGGAAYSVGAIIEFLRWPDVIPGVIGPHELFHFGVIGGVAWHWRAIALAVERARASDPVVAPGAPVLPRVGLAPRPGVVTLGVRDVERSARFCREVLRLTEEPSPEGTRTFDLGGGRVTLVEHGALAVGLGGRGGFGRGVALTVRVPSGSEVAAALGRARDAGGRVVRDASPESWGGVSGTVACPSGYRWQVVFAGEREGAGGRGQA